MLFDCRYQALSISTLHKTESVETSLPPVAAVVSAYNEAKTISTVLDVLQAVHFITQIVVVDDGSTDGTGCVVRSHQERDERIVLLSHTCNQGKNRAMLTGAESLTENLVLFLDADLIGLRPYHVQALCEPVRRGQSDMTLGLFTGGRYLTDLSHRLLPFQSGQRCLRWDLFHTMPDLQGLWWGVEQALSLHALTYGYRVQAVGWPGVTHIMRMEKQVGMLGWWSHAHMWLDITRYCARCCARYLQKQLRR